jgi:mannitol/fructose-specific phosphotransferase system IIA component (Ntr-type)
MTKNASRRAINKMSHPLVNKNRINDRGLADDVEVKMLMLTAASGIFFISQIKRYVELILMIISIAAN